MRPAGGHAARTRRNQHEVEHPARRSSRQTEQGQTRSRRPPRKRDLERQSVQQLRQLAREAGIEGRSSMTKAQLIQALHDHR
jgi:hypothetical protein